MSFWGQIFCNIIGGIIVAILTVLYLKLVKKYSKYNFKKIFGKDSAENFSLVYGNLMLRPSFDENGKSMDWPYYKPGSQGSFFKAFSVASLSETRSAKYLSEAFGRGLNIAPKLISDHEIKEKLDISFCSFGGFNNFKTRDILDSSENRFFDLYPDRIVVKKDKEKIFHMNGDHDYGFIIKIIPKNFPNRVWIAGAGLGEWGTSGTAWFLSKKWKEMPKNKSFGLIIRVRSGQDESAEMIYKI